MRYIYCNYYADGSMYVGRHTWKGEGLDPNYEGSSRVAKKLGMHPISIEILEICTKENIGEREYYWINKYAEEYGIDPRVHNNPWVLKFTKGLMLNGHCNDLRNAEGIASTPEVRRKAANTLKLLGKASNGILTRLSDTRTYSESMRKSASTRHLKYGSAVSRSCREGSLLYKKEHPDTEFGERSVQFHSKGVESRLNNGSYESGSKKVAETIRGRNHFNSISIVCISLIDNSRMEFSQIIDAERYFDFIGEHITRATISQGLRRTNGLFYYKKKYKFIYGGN